MARKKKTDSTPIQNNVLKDLGKIEREKYADAVNKWHNIDDDQEQLIENEDIINALKKLKCWLPDTKESINIDRPMIFDKRWKKKHKGKVQGH